ncbi:MAG: OmpH family outer membrane protein [Elusimicrobia bacterium]|nr:OmpH family outer membrane protein [Elusimicrobiota bacterium]
MKTRLLAAAVLLGLSWPVRVGAIELSLEENKAERGNIGYVDTQRIFKLFPETLKAKENFEEAVRQAEDQVNLRKAEALRLRKELDALKVEREVLARSTPMAPAAPPPVSTHAAAAVPAVISAAAAAMPVVASTAAAAVPIVKSTAAAAAPIVLSTAAAAQPLIINLPGATTGPVVVAPPAGPPAAPAPTITTAAVLPVAPLAAAPLVSTAAALAALDEKIAQKTREFERKQAQARDEQESAEKNLLDLESRKSEILLGKIYKAVQEVARREGVSVVVDKTGILYGHNAVDLTEKVLKYLKGG